MAAHAFALCSESNADPDGVQGSGAVYRIYMPEIDCWNGDLVVYAHGYVAFNEPVQIPEDQLTVPGGGPSLPAIVNALGYAFAVTSYSRNGLAVQEGIADVVDLVEIFNSTHGTAGRVYLDGVSEGGLITALAMERHPEVFTAGLAACGPVGSFVAQTNYFGDFRVVFDYYFPNAFPGDATEVPAMVIDNWDTIYAPLFEYLVNVSPGRIDQLLAVTGASVGDDPATRVQTVLELLWYAAFATNDATAQLGGQPYFNHRRWYSGSSNDIRLNIWAARYTPDPAVVNTMQSAYTTTGVLTKPIVTLHTTGDPVIPYWHESIYRLKTILTGSGAKHINIPINRYGHCNFTTGEIVGAFVWQVILGGGADLSADAESALPVEQRPAFRTALRNAAASQAETGADSPPR